MSSTERQFSDFVRRGYAVATPEHKVDVSRQIAREQEWLADEKRYVDTYDVLQAAEAGELAPVAPGPNYRPNARFLEPRNYPNGFLPFLQPGAVSVLNVLGELWRDQAQRLGVDRQAALAVTSFVRSMEYQALLSQDPGKLALAPEESSHPTGWAFDVDASSYYMMEEGQAPESVSWRDPIKQQKLGMALRRSLGASASQTVIAGPARYDPNAMKALHQSVAVLHNSGFLNGVVEFPGTAHECIHICVNPENFPKQP